MNPGREDSRRCNGSVILALIVGLPWEPSRVRWPVRGGREYACAFHYSCPAAAVKGNPLWLIGWKRASRHAPTFCPPPLAVEACWTELCLLFFFLLFVRVRRLLLSRYPFQTDRTRMWGASERSEMELKQRRSSVQPLLLPDFLALCVLSSRIDFSGKKRRKKNLWCYVKFPVTLIWSTCKA